MAIYQDKIIIITAPSGAGKTSITRYLLAKYPQLSFSISATNRPSRSFETDGKDYYFLSLDSFREKIKNAEFLEWEMVYEGRYYGTLKSEMQRIWNNEQCPLLDIDVKGAIHVQQQYPETSLSIFIDPPSVEELRRRLEGRETETEDTLKDRLNKAAYEISFKGHFNEIILNDNLEVACQKADDIIRKFLGV